MNVSFGFGEVVGHFERKARTKLPHPRVNTNRTWDALHDAAVPPTIAAAASWLITGQCPDFGRQTPGSSDGAWSSSGFNAQTQRCMTAPMRANVSVPGIESRRIAATPERARGTAQFRAMTNPFKQRHGAVRMIHATSHSLAGLRTAYRGEIAFRVETWIAIVLLPLAFWLGRGFTQIALLAGSVALVLIVELLNSAIESAVDRVSIELHDLSKRAKDVASAAVFVAVLLCGAIWLAAVWQRFVA